MLSFARKLKAHFIYETLMGMDVIGEGGSFEKSSEINMKIVPETRVITERNDQRSKASYVSGGRARRRWSEERVLSVGLILISLHR